MTTSKRLVDSSMRRNELPDCRMIVRDIVGKVAALLVGLSWSAACSTPPKPTAVTPKDSLTGSYQFSSGSKRDDVAIAVTIEREGDEWTLGLQAAHPDGHGAAPDGGGTGRIDTDGVFRFSYSDSFDNRGSGTFRRAANGYALSIAIDTVTEPRCMMFYGDFLLRRVAANN